MSVLQAFILGIVQGVTEYLPVSSSAHLLLTPYFLGWSIDKDINFVFNVLIQLGTLFGVFVYFSKDIWSITVAFLHGIKTKKPFYNENAKLGWLLIVATIPGAFFGVTFKSSIVPYFSSIRSTFLFLLVTAFFLVLAELLGGRKNTVVKTKHALAMGFAQSLALFPGISRSGSTIAFGVFFGLTRAAAAKFSFLMSIPIMFGACAVALDEVLLSEELLSALWLPLLVGFVTAAISGYFVIKWFLKFLRQRSLYWFAAYCLGLSLIGLCIYG